MNLKRALCLLLALCLSLTGLVSASAVQIDLSETGADTELAETSANMYNLADNVQDGQILQCWNWSYRNIAANMSKIAQQGFSAVQTSPIQKTKESTREYYNTVQNSSWVVYQPISFTIETNSYNAMGVKSDFEYMCNEAHKYGIKVIVDAVLNHMANDMSGNTIHPSIPSEIKNNSDCWHNYSKDISNYEDRYDVTHHCITGLPDLNTANSVVQKHCKNFLKEAIAAGADGFRFDAAKHIETDWDADGTKSDFWKNVLGEATAYAQETRGITPYYYGEILGTPGGGLSIDAYTQYMSVTDTGSNDIRYAVCSGNAAGAARAGISCGAAPSKTVQWTESHDTYKDNGTKDISTENINKTWAIVGSRNEVCGMYLARPSDINTTMMGDADLTSWTSATVRAINNFKNAFRGQSEYFSSYNNLACVERGTSGMVIVNTGGTYYDNMSAPVHKMASGTYQDAITGNTFTVSNGYISGDIGDKGVAVIYDVENNGVFRKGEVTDVSIVGTFNDWNLDANKMVANNANTASTTMFLDKGTYTFKIATTDGLWYSNAGVIEDTTTSSSSSGWTMSSAVTEKCTLNATGGKYTFTFDVSTGKLIVMHESEFDYNSGYYLKGTFNDWGTSNPFMYTQGSNIVTTEIELEAGTYTFKLNNEDGDIWYSNTGTIENVTNDTGWTFRTGVSDKCTIKATGGKYTFSFNLSTHKLVVTCEADEVVTTAAPTTAAPTTAAPTTAAPTTAEVTTDAPETTTPVVTYPYYLKGDFNNWGTEDPFLATEDNDILTLTKVFEAGTYQFKLFKTSDSSWYGNTGTINDYTGESGWTMKSTESSKCTLKASGGTYTFNLYRSTKKLVVMYTPFETEPTEPTTTAVVTEPTVPATTAVVTEPTVPATTVPKPVVKTGKLQVDVVGGTKFTISINDGAARPQGLFYNNTKLPVGSTVTMRASSASGNSFIGWLNQAAAIVSTDETFTFTSSGNDYFKALYQTSVEGVNLVTFKNDKAANGNGQIIDMQYYAAGDEIVVPDGTTRPGYEFTGWNLTVEEIQAKLAAGEDVTVIPTWEVKKVYVAVTVTGGTITAGNNDGNGNYLANNAVTVTANAAEAGEKFAYWVDANGKVKSYDAEYKFYPATATTLTAVFVSEDTDIEYQALVDLSADATVSGETISYILSWDVPESVGTFKLAGLILVDAADYNADTFEHGSGDAKVFDRALSGAALKAKNVFSINKGSSLYGHTYFAKTWVQYTVGGETVTVYSDMVEVTKLG